MFTHIKIQILDDFFTDSNTRPKTSVYFYRINGYNQEIHTFIQNYYEVARKTGVIIEGKIPNPDEQQLSYYEEMMGMQFQMHVGFFSSALQKWLPRMNLYQRQNVANAMYDALEVLQKKGKTEYMLKNAYIKFMCWLYYKFERIVSQLGEKNIPKILYEGEVSSYELILLSILSNAGCDVVLLQYYGDDNYLKVDNTSFYSNNLISQEIQGIGKMQPFPSNFSLKQLREDMKNAMQKERLYGKKPEFMNCTNAWIEGIGLEDIKKSMSERGTDTKLFYNCYCKINGVEDKLTYLNTLYQFQLALKQNGRNLIIEENAISLPTVEEISVIKRKNYHTTEEMLFDMASNLRYSENAELQALMVKAFLDIMLEYIEQTKEVISTTQIVQNNQLNKLTNQAVYIVCWLKRYRTQLFSNWKIQNRNININYNTSSNVNNNKNFDANISLNINSNITNQNISCFIYLGTCKNINEALFLKILARLPVDILLLNPNMERESYLQDTLLYEINHIESLVVKRFPKENADIHMGTAAYYAERELDTLMYQNTGIYRNQQYEKANTIILQTMYEEIKILWSEELKYRTGFSTEHEQVTLPVIFAKISGVKEKQVVKYWADISELITEDTIVVKNMPYINKNLESRMKVSTSEFFRNGKVQKQKIKANPNYPYSVLREEMQEYILEKLQVLIDKRLIKGTFENGMEYKIVSTILKLPQELLRLIQKFDFTKKNPKMIYINTGETAISIEDTIMVAFLNLIGFDILFFVPTGYQSVETHLNYKVMEEHQIGEYMYDLQVPNLTVNASYTLLSWKQKLFGRKR